MQTPKNEKKFPASKYGKIDNVSTCDVGFISTSTPKQFKADTDDEVVIQCTQEVDDDVDVIWDWNSPRLKQRYIRKQKKLDISLSPKTTIKKHPSNGQIPKFDKLKEEVAALRSQIIKPQETQKSSDIKNYFNEILEDDSLDEQLVLCSQIVEKEFIGTCKHGANMNKSSDLLCTQRNVPDTFHISETMNSSLKKFCDNQIADDSFDVALGQIREEQLQQTATVPNSISCSIPGDLPHDRYQGAFRKSNSVEDAIAHIRKDEISPIKCSPEEIAQKRLQAIAKLQAKKKQEIIERNRREAMKRLELSKKRRVLQHNQFP